VIGVVKIKRLKVVPDERGIFMEILMCDDNLFIDFGHTYMTITYPIFVKGGYYYKKHIDNFIIVHDMIKVVLYDSREDSSTFKEANEFFMGVHNPILLQISQYVYHGFKCITDYKDNCINLPTEKYDYDEPDKFIAEPHSSDILYDWNRKDG